MQEIWKDIEGYEGLYQVSNLGRVKSLNYHSTGKENYLTPHIVGRGYLRVGLSKNNKKTRFLVHRLVACAFIPNPNHLQEVNHKDENKLNNSVWVNEDGSVDIEKSNLEWCNSVYNANYGGRAKRISQTLMKTHPSRRSVIMCDKDWNSIRKFDSISEASRYVGASTQNIIKCCMGKRATAFGHRWKYA